MPAPESGSRPVHSIQTGSDPQVPAYAWVILAVVFIASVAAPLNQFKVSPVMPVLMQAFQMDISSAGWLMSVFAVTGFLLAMPAGIILQRLGLKITGLIAMGCLVIGSCLGAVSTSAGLMLFSRVIEGTGMGLVAVMAPASIAVWFPPAKRGAPMGIWATWVPVGSLVMYLLAPNMALSLGWQSIWWFGAGFALLAFVLVWIFIRVPAEGRPAEPVQGNRAVQAPSMKSALANRKIWFLGAAFGLYNLALICINTFYPTFLSSARAYSLADASLITSLSMLAVTVAAPAAGALSDRFGLRKAFLTWPFLLVAGMMLFPFNLTGVLIPVWMVVNGLLAGAIPTATFSTAPEIMQTPENAGIGLAVVSLGQNLGMFIGPALFGALANSIGWAAAGYWLAPILLLGFGAAWMSK